MTRVPTEDDFKGLRPELTVALHFPDPPASTTAILLLFHGLGDAESPFAAFARAVNLPGVLAIAVRGTSVLPQSLVAGTDADDDASFGQGPQHFHWGDDLRLDGTGQLDDDPGFDTAVQRVDGKLIQDILITKCGWRYDDIMLLGFGQGGTFALALAARVAAKAVETTARKAITDGSPSSGTKGASDFKGIVAIGPAVPSAVTTGASSSAPRLATPVLVCGAAGGEAVSDETQGMLRRRFSSVEVAAWRRPNNEDNGMPRNRAEMLPIMQFLAKRLQR